MDRAVKANILMFCAAGDIGAHKETDYPAAYNPPKIFRIGAAKADGNAWSWAGDMSTLDFIIPGHEVSERESRDPTPVNFHPQTGSSVANALAVGLAALIISCVQLGAIHTLFNPSPTAVAVRDLNNLKKCETMKAAFSQIGTSHESNNKFIEVWHKFDETNKRFRGGDRNKKLERIADLARNIVQHQYQ